MSYKSLYKSYVENDYSTFMKIYQNRFNSSSTIKFNIFIKNHQSFFSYDKDIMSLLNNINLINKRVKKLIEDLPRIAYEQYFRKSLIDEIQFTNEIEGVISTRKDINDLILEIENKAKIENRFYGIVNKYLLLTKSNLVFKDSNDIRKLYNEMLYKEIEKEDKNNLPDSKIFRKDSVSVYSKVDKIVHTGINPEEKIIEYMDYNLDILNSNEIDTLIKVALFHYFFGFIHPFYDGNGRINRFISSYVLSKEYNEILGFRLSMTIKENLTQYLDAFRYTNDERNRADVSTFVYEFLDIIYKSFQKTELYALEKKQLLDKYNLVLAKFNLFDNYKDNNKKDILNVLYSLIQCSLFGDFGLSKSDLKTIINKQDTKIAEYLGILKQLNLCNEFMVGRKHFYTANLDELNKYI